MRKLRTLSTLIIILLISCIFLKSNVNIPDLIKLFSNTKISIWAATIPISIGIFAALGIQIKHSLHPMLKEEKFTPLFHLATCNTLLNYFPGKTGIFARGAYLKKVKNITYKKYTESLILSTTISISISAIIGISLITLSDDLTVLSKENFENFQFSTLKPVLSISAALLLTIILYWQRKLLINIFKNSKNTKRIQLLAINSIIIFFLNSARLFLCFLALDYSVKVEHILLIQSAISLSFILSISPGNLGVKESVLIIVATYVEIDPKIALLAGILDRLSAVIPTFIIGPFSSNYLIDQSKAAKS